MAKFRGTLRKNDLEGGVLQLDADDGTVYEVEAAPDVQAQLATAVDGKVELDGAIDRNAMSFTMTGPRLKVRGFKAV